MSRTVALVYARKSVTQTAADAISPERQTAACLAECQRHGWTCRAPGDVYVDAEGHQSGTDRQRPAWQRLRERLRTDPSVAAVVVESLSRATRSTADLFAFLEELAQRGVALVSLREQFDTSSAMGRAMLGFIGIVNQLEADLASERMAGNIEYKRRARGRHWGLTPYGCDRAGSDGVLVPAAGGVWLLADGSVSPEPDGDGSLWRGYHEALRRCYDLYADAAHSLADVTAALNGEGWRFRDRHGQPRLFRRDDVRRLLAMHELYAGYVTVGSRKGANLRELLEGSHDAILPVELCQQVAAATDERRRDVRVQRLEVRSPARVYLLSGILVCDECGQAMRSHAIRGAGHYRHRERGDCPAPRLSWPCETLDAEVLALAGRLRPADELRALLLASVGVAEGEAERQERQALRRRYAAKLEILKELRLEGEIDRPEYLARKRDIEASLADLADPPPGGTDAAAVIARLERLAEVLARGTEEQQRRAVHALYEEIRQKRGHVVAAAPRAWCKLLLS